jgi:hypothetical protein
MKRRLALDRLNAAHADEFAAALANVVEHSPWCAAPPTGVPADGTRRSRRSSALSPLPDDPEIHEMTIAHLPAQAAMTARL